MRFPRNLQLAVLLTFFSSCVNTKKIVYFNEVNDTVMTQRMAASMEPVIRKSDVLSITVSSLNAEASGIFNFPSIATPLPSATVSTPGSSPINAGTTQLTGYLVDAGGMIKFPVLGLVKADGLTKRALEDTIAQMLSDKKLLIQPLVTVHFLNFRVTVLGEVARPTAINVTNERISILEALGLAGDLTIYGKRENVLLIREEGQKKIIHRIDLTSESILTSPYYYLQTNDIVYVEPNRARIANSSRTQQLLPIVLAGLSFIAVIVTYSLRNN
jgi:polysaccharide export outer membrane protein